MKKLLFVSTVIFLFACAISVKAQISLGVKAGLNLANMNTKNPSLATDNKSVVSYNLGAFVSKKINKIFDIESGLYISGKGSSMEYNQNFLIYSISGSMKTTPVYLELPLDIKYKLAYKKFKFYAFAGPYVAYGIAGKNVVDVSVVGLPIDISSLGINNEDRNIVFGSDSTSDIKRMDYGLNLGIGAEYKKFIFTIQYDLGLTNIAASNTIGYEAKNKTFMFSVGYRIF